MAWFKHACDVDEEANDLLKKLMRKERHSWLRDFRVAVMFRESCVRVNGKERWANAHKASAFERAIGMVDAFVIIGFPAWQMLDYHQREALMDHELRHFAPDDDNPTVIRVVGHDIEEFIDNWNEYGSWAPDMKQAEEQLTLPLGQIDEPKREAG